MKNLIKVLSLICFLACFWTCKKEPDSFKVYDNGKTIIPNITVVLTDAEFNTSLINIDSTDYTLTFKNSNIISSIKTGDIIVSSVGEGLLRKVTYVNKGQGQITFRTDQSSLSEAIQKADIIFGLNNSTNSGLFEQPEIEYIHKGVRLNDNIKGSSTIKELLNNITIDLTIDGDENLQTLDDQISVSGTLSIDQNITGNIKIDNLTLEKLSLAYTIEEQLNLSATYTANLINLEKEIPFLKVTSKVPYVIFVGPFPVLLKPVLTLYAGVDFTADSKITTSVNQSFNFTTGITYESKKWTPYAQVDKSFDFVPPKISGEASAKVYVRPELSLKIDGCLAPTLSTPIYTQLSASTTDNPWWNLKAGIQGDIGINMEIFSKVILDLSTNLFDISYPITQATGGIPKVPVVSTLTPSTITQTSAIIGGNVTDDGGATVTDRGVYYSRSANPETTGTKVQIGNGTGIFNTTLSGLAPNTPYYIKAYATNSMGPSYGNQISFTTLPSNIPMGKISGIVRDAVTALPLSNVAVNVFISSTSIATSTSQNDGGYEINVPVNTGYKVIFVKQGYLNAEYQNINVTTGGNTILEPVLQIDQNYSGNGNISGTIKNALNGTGVPNVSLNLRNGINVTSGEIITSTTSSSSGTFTFNNISAGNYTIEAGNSDFNTTYFTVICLGGQTVTNQDVTMSPKLNIGEMRIVLTWGESPSDLDSHLTGPLADGTRFHMFYTYSGIDSSPWPETVTLDLDDVTSYGPETTTLLQQISGIYRFSVHDYSDRYSTDSYELSNSGAQVRVYQNTGLVASFNVPPNTGGTLWTVFEMSNGVISPINQMNYESDPENVTKGRYINPEISLFKNLPKK
jgi:hypothetical protein